MSGTSSVAMSFAVGLVGLPISDSRLLVDESLVCVGHVLLTFGLNVGEEGPAV
jgi:hypothetical protein